MIPQIDCISDIERTLLEDYESAVVHVAWNRRQQDRTLLVAWVELLPKEVPTPTDDGEPFTRIKDDYLYVRHVVTTADRGVRWYRDCARSVAVRPENDGRLLEEHAACGTMALSSLEGEPPWPNLVCTRSAILPFLANWYYCPRAHHLISTDFDPAKLWAPTVRARAQQWLRDQLHIDFVEFQHLWGSVHLVAPNPIFRNASTRLEEVGATPRERILVHVQPRAGKRVDGIEFRFVEERTTGVCVSKTIKLTSPALALQFDHVLEQTLVEIHDPVRGLLWQEPASAFLRQIVMQGSLVVGKRVIADEAGNTIEIPMLSDLQPTTVGLAPPTEPTTAAIKLAEAKARHEKRTEAKRLEQHWFNGQPGEALKAVTKLIGGAFQQVLIVDPYFGRPELRFAMANGRARIPVRVLTSNDGLIEHEKRDGQQAIEKFVTVVERIVATPNTNPVEVRVMAGAGIHDRFVVIDDRVFLLGSSLNSFGVRGTMLIQLPDPDPVRLELLREWGSAKPLKDWLDDRRRARQGASGTSS